MRIRNRYNGSQEVRASGQGTTFSGFRSILVQGLQRVKGWRLRTRYRLNMVLRESSWCICVSLHVHVYICICMNTRKENGEGAESLWTVLPRDKAIISALSGPNQANQPPTASAAYLSSSYPLSFLLSCPLILCSTFAPRPCGPTPFGYLLKRALPPLIYRVQLPTPVLYLSLVKQRLSKQDQDFWHLCYRVVNVPFVEFTFVCHMGKEEILKLKKFMY